MNAPLRRWLLLPVILLQIGLPALQILRYEQTLHAGETIRLRTQPVDPYDPFRGRYVRLSFGNWSVPVEGTAPASSRRLEHLYVRFTNDPAGFACASVASYTAPEAGPYLRVPYRGYVGDSVNLSPPFDRFYANEERAPELERLYREAHAAGRSNTYALVRVLGGRGVIADLVLGSNVVSRGAP